MLCGSVHTRCYINQCVTRKINGVIKNGRIFPSKVGYFQYDNRFLFSREMGNIRSCKLIRLQKLIKFRLSGQYLFWHFSSCLKMKNLLGRVSPSIFCKIFQYTAQKMTFFSKDFFRKCDQICSFLQIWSHLLKKSLMENFIFCAVIETSNICFKNF